MTTGQTRFPIAPSKFKFAQHGQSGMWVCELLPYTAKMVDDMCFIRTHAHRGHQPRAGHHLHADRQPDHRPALPRAPGSPTASALNENLPTFVVLVAKPTIPRRRCRRSRPGCGRRATCPASTPASRSAPPATRSCTSTIRPACRRQVRRRTLDGAGRAERAALREARRPRDADAHRAVRDGLPHAGLRAGADRPLEGARAAPSSSTATTREKPGTFAHTLPAGPPAGRARRALRADLPQQLGPARQPAGRAAQPVQGRRPGLLRR